MEGSRGGAVGAVGADAVVFGTLASVALRDPNQSDVALSWGCVALSWSAGWQQVANASAPVPSDGVEDDAQEGAIQGKKTDVRRSLPSSKSLR